MLDKTLQAFQQGGEARRAEKMLSDNPYAERRAIEVEPGRIVAANPLWFRGWRDGWTAMNKTIPAHKRTRDA